jgi:hypothetical protein
VSFNGFKKIICSFVLVLFVSQNVFAQDNQSTTKNGPKKQLTMVFLAGLGGAVLGLSTLSFYGRPQAHLKNIAGGFALGIIVGTIYMTYNTTTKPKQYLGDYPDEMTPEVFNLTPRESLDFKPTPEVVSYNFTF